MKGCDETSLYENISKYYDLIFPVSKDILIFISSIVGNTPKSIIDIACGTGGYSTELAKQGYDMTAVDLDNQMIKSLKEKANHLNNQIKFLQSNMLNLNQKFNINEFDVAFCIGNSLVHLESLDQINEFFKNVKRILKINGSLIIQIINYDRVIFKKIKSLPTIHNDAMDLTFERYYRYEEEQNKIYFKTVLSVGDQRHENEIPLYPLLFDDIKESLINTGFKDIEFFGDFNRNGFDKNNSYMLVLCAKK